MQTIEENVRFSQSKLWDYQKAYYREKSIDAWAKHDVPDFITSNPVIAQSYARTIAGFLRDINKPHETVYILELGAGHGRFSYYFLRHFIRLIEQSSFPYPKFCYVISDCVENNLEYLQKHPKLICFAEKGLLDFALFDAESSKTLTLKNSGVTIGKEQLSSPLIIIANYFFDVLRQELFYIKDNKIHNCPLTLHSKEEALESAETELLQIEQLVIGHTYEESRRPLFDEQYFNKAMDYYRQSLSETYLLFPAVGLRCIEKLRQLSTEGLMLLTADKGYNHCHQLDGLPFPFFAAHDNSFSLMVNYHAFQMYCRDSGGSFIIPKHDCSSINVNCFLFIHNSEKFKETRLEYDAFTGEYGPDEFCTLITAWSNKTEQMKFSEWTSLIRYSGYDSRIFTSLLPQLYGFITNLSVHEKISIIGIAEKIWDMHYPLQEDLDIALELGKMLIMAGFPKEAIKYLTLSVNDRGYHSEAVHNLIFCYCHIKDYDSGIELLESLRLHK